MSTLAVSTLLDAMAAAPRLTKLKLGPVRDEVQRRRHQLLTMEAVERARRERAGSPELKRRANSPELKRRENSPEIKRRAAAAASKRLSAQMKERASPIPSYTYYGSTYYGWLCLLWLYLYGWLYLLWLAMLAMAVRVMAVLALAIRATGAHLLHIARNGHRARHRRGHVRLGRGGKAHRSG